MTGKLTVNQIKGYWEKQALKFAHSPAVSWSDHRMIEMEIREITRYLEDGDTVLDIGCANGFSTVKYALEKDIEICGIDYISEMIRQAGLRLKPLAAKRKGKITFRTGNVLCLKVRDNGYDKVITTRVLINLGNWKNQQKGLLECMRVLKPGGILLLSEATVQGWKKLNAFRHEWQLPAIPMPSFNFYLDERKVLGFTSRYLEPIAIVNFSSTYYVGTRVLKPLLAKASGADINVADPHMEWNRWLARLPAWGDYGTQKLFIFKKK
ncbi:MAG: class I SAM-dependent methyltransferase [Chlamydiota bacterium]